ncbi:hypothetical protein CRG98_012181 [Punica granatum]|uniref:Uncharacterized protein n=1 Tax=Punica granatum TaxID=22663 RepID=A0A2I0KG02_PUNGR|nr:hypothetical protein CRG98_012181 [Punica granatum]
MCRGLAIGGRLEGGRVLLREWPFMKRDDPRNMCIRPILSPNFCLGREMRDNLARYLCKPEFNLVGARMHKAYATRLGSIHLPGDARRTHVRKSRHLLFTTRRSRAVESPGSRGTAYT